MRKRKRKDSEEVNLLVYANFLCVTLIDWPQPFLVHQWASEGKDIASFVLSLQRAGIKGSTSFPLEEMLGVSAFILLVG